jgi:ABC-type amino acid transport substrate-binding protein
MKPFKPIRVTNRMTRLFLILILWATSLLVACRTIDDRWDAIAESGILRIGLDPTYPPFETAVGDEVYGLDVDLARLLAQDLGLEPQFIYFGYDGLYDALTTGQVDVLISALVIAPERTRDIAYTPAYFDAGQFLYFVQESNDTIRSVNDLANLTLAVELGALGHVSALELQRQNPGLEIVPFPSAHDALEALIGRTVDAALIDQVSARLYMREKELPQTVSLKQLPDPIMSEPYAIAVRIGDQTLLEKLTASLNALKDKGELNRLGDLWLGQ